MIMNKLAYETLKKYLITVSKMIEIAIGDRKATIAISNLIEIEIAIAIFAIVVMP